MCGDPRSVRGTSIANSHVGSNLEAVVRLNNLRALVVAIVLAAAPALPSQAGEIKVAWDSVPGANGYHVYYGVQSGVYGSFVPAATNSATISGLQDCKAYYIAVKAFNGAGESPSFSNELSGWARPSITSATPSSARQGDQINITITGANFQSGAVVDLGNPNVFLTSTYVDPSCREITVVATVEPTAGSVRPAQIGRLDLTVSNTNSVFGMKSQAFEVLINPSRFDINQSDDMTRNRIDGKDTVYLSRLFGVNDSNPNYDADDDFDGDGWIDGQDLAYIASNLGRCWSTSAKSWSLAACPTALQ